MEKVWLCLIHFLDMVNHLKTNLNVVITPGMTSRNHKELHSVYTFRVTFSACLCRDIDVTHNDRSQVDITPCTLIDDTCRSSGDD